MDASTLSDELDLDIRNPHVSVATLPSPAVLVKRLQGEAERIQQALRKLQRRLEVIQDKLHAGALISIGSATYERDERIGNRYTPDVRLIGVTNAGGISPPKTRIGKSPDKYKIVALGDLVYNPMRINIGSIGIALSEEETGITSPDYVVFACKEDMLPEYVYHFLKSEAGRQAIRRKTRGSVRFRLYYDRLAEIDIPRPKDQKVQQEFVDLCRELDLLRGQFVAAEGTAEESIASLRSQAFAHFVE